MWVVDKVKRFVFVFAMYTGLSMASRGEFMVFLPMFVLLFFYLPANLAINAFHLSMALAQSFLSEEASVPAVSADPATVTAGSL